MPERRASPRLWPRVLAVVAVVGLWWIVSGTGLVDPSDLPSPARVWSSLSHHVADGSIPEAVEKSVIRLAFSMAVAAAFGTLLGVAMAASPIVQRSVGSLVVGLQALPSIAWLPLAILWLGPTERAVVFVVIVGAFPAIALATAAGVRQVPPVLVRAGRTLGATGWTLYRRVVVPAALPAYVEGLRAGWVFAWRALMAAELIVAGGIGLGHFLDRAGRHFHAATVLALMVVVVVIGLLVDLGFSVLDRRVRARRGLLQVAST